ncbi:MAG: aminoglycoside phosphotransferase family protein [Rothia sp. (in: high G+C Gram-positive bacteria)]|nr:aminoglycoside phosphotransferase family protein [Rothia sp. (in: high G+C Gram-positive bacteria)]
MMSTATNPATSQRITWTDLPLQLQDWVQHTIGATITHAESQTGGFSLGTADRLQFSNGQRAFLKAVNSATQEFTATLHRQEAHILQQIPPTAPVPKFIATTELNGWVAILIEDIEGNHPQHHWEHNELTAVFNALDQLAQFTVPKHLKLHTTAESLADEIGAWDTLAHQEITPHQYSHLKNHPDYTEFISHIPTLNQRAPEFSAYINAHLRPHLTGTTYNHTDLRSDNILITPKNTATIVDWPWTCTGPPAFDSAALIVDLLTHNPHHNINKLTNYSQTLQQAPPHYLEATITYAAGFYTWAAQTPPDNHTLNTLPAMRLHRALTLNTWVLKNI